MKCNTDARQEKLMKVLSEQFNCSLAEIENSLCETYRRNKKKDIYFAGQMLWLIQKS